VQAYNAADDQCFGLAQWDTTKGASSRVRGLSWSQGIADYTTEIKAVLAAAGGGGSFDTWLDFTSLAHQISWHMTDLILADLLVGL
jgi:hypothetical protein